MTGLLQLGAVVSAGRPDGFAAAAALVRGAGIEWVQLNLDQPGWSEQDLNIWASILQDYDLEIGAVACPANLLRPHETSVMGASLEDLKRAIDCSLILGASKFIAWSGTFGDGLFDWHPDNTTDRGREALGGSFLELLPLLEDHGAQLVIEPAWMHALNTPETCLDFAALLPRNRVTFVCNPALLIRPGDFARRDELVIESIESLRHLLSVVHLGDLELNSQGGCEYCGPGRGKLDYAAFLSQLNALAVPLLAVIEHTPLEALGAVAGELRGLE